MTNKEKANIIEKAVADAFGVTVAAMRERRRHREVVEPRQFAMRLMIIYTNMTTTAIGAIFGKDHSTVCHAAATVDDLIRWNDRMELWKHLNVVIVEKFAEANQRERVVYSSLPSYYLQTVR
jgi:chromosomal replication initiator protein